MRDVAAISPQGQLDDYRQVGLYLFGDGSQWCDVSPVVLDEELTEGLMR